MATFVKEELRQNGVSEEVIATLEEQELLIDSSSLAEVDVNLLLACGIKAGQALKVVRAFKDICANDGTGVSENYALPLGMQSEPQLVDDGSDEDGIDSNEEITKESPPMTPRTKNNSSTTPFPTPPARSPFTFEETVNKTVLDDFDISEIKFSPAVLHGLQNKCLTCTLRSEFIRDICTNLLARGVHYLKKKDRDAVALQIVMRHPHLKDPIGSGLGSWSESILNRMKHVRKYDAKKRKLAESSSPSVSYEENKPKAARKTSEINRRDFWKEVPNVSSIAPEVHSDHILALRKETGLSKPDQRKLRELMRSTYELRRKNILGSVILIKEIIGEYPPLSTCAGICQEFGRIMKNENLVSEEKQIFSDNYAEPIVKYARQLQRKQSMLKNTLASLDGCVAKEPNKKKAFQAACAAIVLPNLLKCRGFPKHDDSIIEFTTDDPDSEMDLQRSSKFPKLVLGAGDEICDVKSAFICAEGEKIVTFGDAVTIDSALLTLHAVYYVFNISYPPKWKDVFFFIDTILCGIKDAAAKRISLQNFISQLHA